MAVITTQRFIAGLTVFDTYSGFNGTIVQMNLNDDAVNPVAPLYVGAYFVVQFTDLSLQLFTLQGKRVDSFSGLPLTGVTLLTNAEKTALLGAGYPAK